MKKEGSYMTSKEFDLLLAMMLTLLEKGEVEEVIRLIKEARADNKKND